MGFHFCHIHIFSRSFDKAILKSESRFRVEIYAIVFRSSPELRDSISEVLILQEHRSLSNYLNDDRTIIYGSFIDDDTLSKFTIFTEG